MKTLFACVLFLALFLIGCGKENSSNQTSNAPDKSAFESAPAAQKAEWEKVLDGIAKNDPVVVILTCRKLQAFTDLTPEQRDAVNAIYGKTNNDLMERAGKGDQAAINALQEIRRQWR